MEYQDRVNRPLGMSDVDLLIYDKDIYTLFRTHEGLETDAFRYDPIVSAGILASDYAFAHGMAWVNLLTPDSQDKINAGDDLVVPVQTYDNYEQNPPIEKYLTHEVSFTANQLNLVRAEGLHNEFVGDFNNYFNEELGLTGTVLNDSEDGTITTTPTVPKTGIFTDDTLPKYPPVNTPIFTAIDNETGRPRPTGTSVPPVTKKIDQNYINSLVASANVKGLTREQVYNKYKTCVAYVKQFNLAPNRYGCKPIWDKFNSLINKTTTVPCTPFPSCLGPEKPKPKDTVGGSGSGTTTGGGGTTTGGGGTTTGGGGTTTGGGGGGGVSPEPQKEPQQEPKSESKQENKSEDKKEVAKTKDEKNKYFPIYIGIAIFGLIGYMYASTKKKDVKSLSLAGAIIGGLIGYLYMQHQEKPIDLISKIGIKSKNSK